MKRLLRLLSCCLCVCTGLGYLIPFFHLHAFPSKFLIIALILFSSVGLLLALFNERNVVSYVGFYGNFLVLLMMAIIPAIMTAFIWNTP